MNYKLLCQFLRATANFPSEDVVLNIVDTLDDILNKSDEMTMHWAADQLISGFMERVNGKEAQPDWNSLKRLGWIKASEMICASAEEELDNCVMSGDRVLTKAADEAMNNALQQLHSLAMPGANDDPVLVNRFLSVKIAALRFLLSAEGVLRQNMQDELPYDLVADIKTLVDREATDV